MGGQILNDILDAFATEFEVYIKIVDEPLPLASTLYPNVTSKLDTVIFKATTKKQEDRYQSCQEFLEDISTLGINNGTNLPIEKVNLKSTELSNLPDTSLTNFSDQVNETDDLQVEVEKSEKLEQKRRKSG